MDKHFHVPLEGASTHGIVVRHMIRIVSVTHVLVVPFHDVTFHGAVAVTNISSCWWWVRISHHVNLLSLLPHGAVAVTNISFCCWCVHVSQHINFCLSFQSNAVKPPLVLTLMSPLFNFSCFDPKSGACLFCWAMLTRMNLFYVCPSYQKVLGIIRNCP